MKISRYSLILFSLFLCVSCNTTSTKKLNTNEVTKESSTKNIVHVEMSIEGMTCEIGCAKIIESKVSKLQGVQFSKVSFKNKKGVFSYDNNTISKKDITEKINGIAGGNLYKVTHTKELDSILK